MDIAAATDFELLNPVRPLPLHLSRRRLDFELIEQWNVPVLAPNRKSDFLTSVQLTFWPKHWARVAAK